MVKEKKAKKHVVFFDFDNTITVGDVLDDMLARYSINFKWQELEKQWKDGEIGSKQCLESQIKGVRITKKELDRYLSGIRIDPYFKVLLRYLRSRKIKTIILSDNFDYILNRILKKNDIANQVFYANRLKLDGNRLMPAFPFANRRCGDCGHCKKTTLLTNAGKDAFCVYIGDGLSDVCASQYANIVFAKDSLRRYYRRERKPHIGFDSLRDVYRYLKKTEEE